MTLLVAHFLILDRDSLWLRPLPWVGGFAWGLGLKWGWVTMGYGVFVVLVCGVVKVVWYIIHNYEIPEFNNIEDAFYIPKKGKNVGKKYKLPLTNYRSQILNRNTEILQIYEYKHFWHLKYKELEQGIDLQGIEIRINLSKSFRCVEDKDIYKRWNSIKLGDLISEMDKEKKN